MKRIMIRNSHGYAAITVLVLVTALTVLALMSSRVALDRRERSARSLEKVTTRHAAHSGILIAAALLTQDETSWDGPGDPWFNPVHLDREPHPVTVTIIDEQSRLSLSHLVRPSGAFNDALIAVFNQISPGKPFHGEAWRDGLNRWRTIHGHRRLSLDAALKILRPGEIPCNDCLTVYGNGRININTAPEQLLTATGGEPFRRAVVNARHNTPLKSVFDPAIRHALPPNAASLLDTRTSYFRVITTATGTFVTSHVETVLWRRSGQLVVITQREWWS